MNRIFINRMGQGADTLEAHEAYRVKALQRFHATYIAPMLVTLPMPIPPRGEGHDAKVVGQ